MVKLIAEIGINHNGDLDTCKKMILAAKDSGADYVKFQKRDPDICVPEAEKSNMRQTPWGEMTYLDYKHRIEFNEEYKEIDAYCESIGIKWCVSVWDLNSVDFIANNFSTALVKIPSAKATDIELMRKCTDLFDTVIVSTGMCTTDEVYRIFKTVGREKLILFHTVSTYPSDHKELRMDTIQSLKSLYYVPVGYSGHEPGTLVSAASVYQGATWIEKHFTLDKTMWGTDQSASLEPSEFKQLREQVDFLSDTLGVRDGVLESEIPIMKKLR